MVIVDGRDDALSNAYRPRGGTETGGQEELTQDGGFSEEVETRSAGAAQLARTGSDMQKTRKRNTCKPQRRRRFVHTVKKGPLSIPSLMHQRMERKGYVPLTSHDVHRVGRRVAGGGVMRREHLMPMPGSPSPLPPGKRVKRSPSMGLVAAGCTALTCCVCFGGFGFEGGDQRGSLKRVVKRVLGPSFC